MVISCYIVKGKNKQNSDFVLPYFTTTLSIVLVGEFESGQHVIFCSGVILIISMDYVFWGEPILCFLFVQEEGISITFDDRVHILLSSLCSR